MTSVAEAQEKIRDHARPLDGEQVELKSAHGRILRETIRCPEDMPPFDRSAMDGYAVRADDENGKWKVVGEIRAGENIDRQLQAGEAMRIFTGARLPGAGLKVIMQEDVEAGAESVRLLRASEELHIRRQGEDARAGEALLHSGTGLNPAAVALLASVGKTSVLVARRSRILHLTTGDEIVAPDLPLRPGEIRNSNSFLVATLCREWGGEVTHFHAPDHLQTMIDLLARAEPKNYDLILISGGSGGGKYDFTADVFRHLSAEIHFRQVAVRPGKPLIFGSSPGQLVFGLPGNALSHFVCFHLFVRPALVRLRGSAADSTGFATLTEPVLDSENRRETWWPAQTGARDGRVEVSALFWKSSGDITRLPAANALIRVPANTARLSAGDRLEYLSLRADL